MLLLLAAVCRRCHSSGFLALRGRLRSLRWHGAIGIVCAWCGAGAGRGACSSGGGTRFSHFESDHERVSLLEEGLLGGKELSEFLLVRGGLGDDGADLRAEGAQPRVHRTHAHTKETNSTFNQDNFIFQQSTTQRQRPGDPASNIPRRAAKRIDSLLRA